MRYFLSAAGRTFQVGSSKLTLKLLRLSELSCLAGFCGASKVFLDFSKDGLSVDEPALRLEPVTSCSARCGDPYGGDSISPLVGDFCGWFHLKEGCLRSVCSS